MDEYLTQEGYEKLKDDLEHLKTVRRRELSKAIGAARAHGDISENAEYDAAKHEQGLNEKRIDELEIRLGGAKILNNDEISSDTVLVGATVKLKDVNSGKELRYTLVSELEANFSLGKISITSPIGKGLLRHKVNDIVEIKIPAGILKYKILNISR